MLSFLAFNVLTFCEHCFLEDLPNEESPLYYYARSIYSFRKVLYYDIFDKRIDWPALGFTPHVIDIFYRKDNLVKYEKYCCYCDISPIIFNNRILFYKILRKDIGEVDYEKWKLLVGKMLKNIWNSNKLIY